MFENLNPEEPVLQSSETNWPLQSFEPPAETPAEPSSPPPAAQVPPGPGPLTQPNDTAVNSSKPPTDWRAALREDFERWLAGLEGTEPPDWSRHHATEVPDLFTFYEQLVAANAEARKSNRRTAEAITQWGETLARFDSALSPLRETITALTAAQPKPDQMSRSHCLLLLELLDRLDRIARAFASPEPSRSWWRGSDLGWRQRWESQRQALNIVISHLGLILQQQGVTRMESVNKPFNPVTMAAVAVAPDPVRPDNTVLEELAPGYQRHGELLRPAQVKVCRNP
jgi:molecular chaperone GrpE (heat shock protein)